MTDFKKYLQFLPPKDQIYEINFMIGNSYKSIKKVKILIKHFAY